MYVYICRARRYEIVFAMATTVYLLFVTMYTTKESLEHLLMEKSNASTEDHHHEARLGFGGFLIMCIAMSATVLSSVSLRNHENFVRCKYNENDIIGEEKVGSKKNGMV